MVLGALSVRFREQLVAVRPLLELRHLSDNNVDRGNYGKTRLHGI